MTINKHNYEAYFLDYLEGNLTVELQAELMVFLEANPDLKAELEMMSEDAPVLIEEEGLSFEFKGSLKKNKLFTDDELIAVIEKDAPVELVEKVKSAAIQDKDLAKEITLFEKTKLPNEVITFADKESLKRRATIIPLFYRAIAVAASLLIVFMIGRNYFNTTDKGTQIARIENNVPKDEEQSTSTKAPAVLPANNSAEKIQVASKTKKERKETRSTQTKHDISQQSALADNSKEASKERPLAIKEQPVLAQTKTEETPKEKIINPPTSTIVEPTFATAPANKYDSPADYILEQTTGVKAQNSFKEKWLNRLQYAAAIYQKATGNKAQVKKGENDCGIRYDIALGRMEFSKTIACK